MQLIPRSKTNRSDSIKTLTEQWIRIRIWNGQRVHEHLTLIATRTELKYICNPTRLPAAFPETERNELVLQCSMAVWFSPSCVSIDRKEEMEDTALYQGLHLDSKRMLFC